jgi:hypothetical protein
MNKRDLQQARADKYMEIITKLNRRKRWGENQIFDCGELGFLHIWWHQQWYGDWFEPSTEFKPTKKGNE